MKAADGGSSNLKTRSEYALAMGLSRERVGLSQRGIRSPHAQSRSTKLARLLPSPVRHDRWETVLKVSHHRNPL